MVESILLVEGGDDEHVIKNLLVNHSLPHLEVVRCGGCDTLLRQLELRSKASKSPAVLGAVVDADTSLNVRWQAVRDRLMRVGYDVPDVPNELGTVMEPPENSVQSRVGVWIMPDNQIPGILEDFVQFLVPDSDPLFAHAKAVVDQLPPQLRRFGEKDRAKVHLHTWLAWQERPGQPLGQAIRSKVLNAHAAFAQPFINWLRRLYG